MPIIDGIKFSCAPCVKGHRSANCPHEERPLIEIKKKGRPTTHCEKCRELRKSKAIQSKCICPPNGNAPDVAHSTPAPTTLSRNPSSSASSTARKPHDAKHRPSHSHRNHYDPLFPFNQLPHDSNQALVASTSQYVPTQRPYDNNLENKGKQVFHQYEQFTPVPSANYPPIQQVPSTSRAIYFPPSNPYQSNNLLPLNSNPIPNNSQYPLPTSSCFCGAECDCQGCPIHFPLSPEEVQLQMIGAAGAREMQCGAQCMSFGLCSASGALNLPAGISSMEELLSIVQTQTSQSTTFPPPPFLPPISNQHPLPSPYQTQGQTPAIPDVSALFEQQLSALQAWPSTSDLARFRSSSFTSDYSGSYASSAQSSVHDGYDPNPNPVAGIAGIEGEQRFDERVGGSFVQGVGGVDGITRWRNDLPELEMGLGNGLSLDGGNYTGPVGGGSMYQGTNGLADSQALGNPTNDHSTDALFSYLQSQPIDPLPALVDYPPLPSPSSTYYYYPSDYAPSSHSQSQSQSIHSSSALPSSNSQGQGLYRSASTSSSAASFGDPSNGKHDSVNGDIYSDFSPAGVMSSNQTEGNEGMFDGLDLGGYGNGQEYGMDYSLPPSSIPIHDPLLPPHNPPASSHPSTQNLSQLHTASTTQSTTFEPSSPPRRSPSANNPSLAIDRYKTERPADPLPNSTTNSSSKEANGTTKSKSKLSFGGFGGSFSRSNSGDSTNGNGGNGKGIRRELSMERTKTERPIVASGSSPSGSGSGSGGGKGIVGLLKKVKDKF